MAACRAGVEDDESCMSCLHTTKYCCMRCKFPLCNKCAIPEVNEDIPGWKAGKFVGYCLPCSKEAFEQGTQCSTHVVGGNGGKGKKPRKRAESPFR